MTTTRDSSAFLSAASVPLEELTRIWNAAYEGYFVPLAFTPDLMARHLDRAGVDLELSCVLALDEGNVGLSLSARRGDLGYLAGFGIARVARRKGWARLLLRNQIANWRDAGLFQVQLEVIEENPARQLYAQGGFVMQRLLQAYEGKVEAGAGLPELVTLDEAALAQAHSRLNAGLRPTWRREFPSLAKALHIEGVRTLGIEVHGDVTAYAVVQPAGARLAILDAAAYSAADARLLLQALAARSPGMALRLVDEPEGTALSHAASALMGRVLRQVEMVRATA
ncbi:MAG: GNAT family N-acetyltransferase [Burkholderiaceae bacterium]